MRSHHVDRCLTAIVVLAVCICQGCGTGEYEKRLQKQVAGLEKGSVFQQLYDPSPLEGTPIFVRVPKVFKQSLKEGSIIDGSPVDPRRTKPPKVDLLGGLKIAYEAIIADSDGNETSYYLYFAVVDVAKAEKTRFTAQRTASTLKATGTAKMHRGGKLYQSLEKAFPGAVTEWEDVQCPTFDGHKVVWQKVRATGNQEFYSIDRNKQQRYATVPGVLEFYVRQEGDLLVLIIWRIPTSIESQVKLAELAPLVAGSVTTEKSGQ